jgi:acyl carrier protein
MELQAYVKQFAQQFDDTDPSEITAGTVFHDLEEWSSLVALAVLNMTEKKFGKKITFDEMKACVTVNDLFELVNTKA